MIDKEFLFIIGSARSGTTWLQAMLGNHPKVCTTVELTLYHAYIAPLIATWKNETVALKEQPWSGVLPFLWSEDEFYAFLRDFLNNAYTKVLEFNPDATHILDKMPGNSAYTEEIKALIPHARFIHIIRDGRDVVASLLAAYRDLGFGASTAINAAKIWKEMVISARSAKQYDGQYLEVRYEDLVNKTSEVLSTVFDFCGLEYTLEQISAIIDAHQFEDMKHKGQTADPHINMDKRHYRKGKIGSWREDLDPVQRFVLNRIAGDLLCELGYASNNNWITFELFKYNLPVIFFKEFGNRPFRLFRSAQRKISGFYAANQ